MEERVLQAGDFRLALILVGIGQGLFLVPTLFYATRDVKPEQGPAAAALFINADTRNAAPAVRRQWPVGWLN